MIGRDVLLDAVSVTYPNGFTAVHPTDLHVKAGEFFSILGPSGCGKTTLLRALSGFIDPTQGTIRIGGDDQAGLGPNQRPTALIFQNLALFPLMTVAENVAFGLEARGIGKRERLKRAEELLDLVALSEQARKRPTELSGGQRQRVAIARALAVEPSVLLLDEPLSALDLKLRQHMRAELRAIQQRTGVTFVYITHDQGEALAMSDRVAVMNEGRIEQVGSSDDVYSHPRTAFVASFVGEANRFSGRVAKNKGDKAEIETPFGIFIGRNPLGLAEGQQAHLFVRPEALCEPKGRGRPVNQLTGTLSRRELEGPVVNLVFHTDTGLEVAVQTTNDGSTFNPDAKLTYVFDPERAVILPIGSLARTGREESLAA